MRDEASATSEKKELADVLTRPYPQRVAGKVLSYAFDVNVWTATIRWEPDSTVDAPTEIAFPVRIFSRGVTVDCGGCTVEEVRRDHDSRSLTQRRTASRNRSEVRRAKIAVVIVVIGLLVTAQRFGVFEQFEDPERVRDTLVQLGPWGYLAFVLAYAALQPFGVPGTVFVMAAPLIWPWPVAYALSMVGTMAASVIGFSFSRFVARDWIATKIPQRFRRYDDALERHAFRTVVLLRFVFWMPQLLHAFLGLSKVRFWTHFWGSLVGYAIPLLLVSYFGQKLFDAMKHAPREAWIALGAAAVALALTVWLVRRRRAANAPD